MSEFTENVEFERTKIYERLDHQPEPMGYKNKVPWTVQQQIGATNGVHYKQLVGKLVEYPEFELPVEANEGGLMLDIGCGWGRWLVGGTKKGYIPIGIDLRLEFCQTARNTLRDLNKNGYSLVADLKKLPFKDNLFDLVWSFSVLQHTHINRFKSCLRNVNRILKPNSGVTTLQLPNRMGLRNRLGPVKYERNVKEADDYNSWCVRYYSPDEYKKIFKSIFGNYNQKTHSFFGIGVLKEDIKYLHGKQRYLSYMSRIATRLSNIIPLLQAVSDSLYCISTKNTNNAELKVAGEEIEKFKEAHANNPSDNLNIIHLLQCPISGGSLELDNEAKKVISKSALVYYPIENEIPIIIESEARPL